MTLDLADTVECPSCEQAFAAELHSKSAWLICPHCGARGPNPLAHRRSIGLNASAFIGFVGVGLIVVGVFGAMTGTLIVVAAGGFGPSADLGRPVLVLCGFLLILASGVAFFDSYKVQQDGQTALPKLRAAMLLLGGALAAFCLAFGFCMAPGF